MAHGGNVMVIRDTVYTVPVCHDDDDDVLMIDDFDDWCWCAYCTTFSEGTHVPVKLQINSFEE